MINSIDRKILNIIQYDSRISNVDLARKLNMVPSAVLGRRKKLENQGMVLRYEAALNPKLLGLGMTCFIMVRSQEEVGIMSVGEKLAKIQEVQEVHFLAGEYCYVLKVRVSDTAALRELIKKFGKIKGIRDTRTTLVLETIKETTCLPIPLNTEGMNR
jgi:Lrp/AsnC family transcriptional regulator, leucine-responsive regulatory protein